MMGPNKGDFFTSQETSAKVPLFNDGKNIYGARIFLLTLLQL